MSDGSRLGGVRDRLSGVASSARERGAAAAERAESVRARTEAGAETTAEAFDRADDTTAAFAAGPFAEPPTDRAGVADNAFGFEPPAAAPSRDHTPPAAPRHDATGMDELFGGFGGGGRGGGGVPREPARSPPREPDAAASPFETDGEMELFGGWR